MKNSKLNTLVERYEFMVKEINRLTNCDEIKFVNIKQKLLNFKSEYKTRWEKACRIEETFIKNNKSWLDTSLSFPSYSENVIGKKRGRPQVSFEDCSEQAKRLKTKELRNTTSLPVLLHATCMKLKAEGQVKTSNVIKDMTSSSPNRASEYQKAYKEFSEQKQKLLSGEDALAVLVDAKLSREQYNVIRKNAPEKFPSYKVVQAAKKLCYPVDITATEIGASVKLQSLLDHTVERLCLTIEPVLEHLQLKNNDSLTLISKWGFDGSSGHSSYKQAFCDIDANDSSVFITCLVPIRLTFGEIVIWQNSSPASTRYCRPIKIEFKKETTNFIIEEKKKIDEEIRNIQNSNVLVQSKQIGIKHELIFSMVDGKVCNAVTETTSTMRCFICGATSTHFNKIDEMIARDIKIETLDFGLSVLHGWIRSFECLLHLAYKMPIKKWQARGKEDQAIVAQRKSQIQKEFKERCGLIVDKPKPGFGNSNDGNTARRFFQNAELSSEITGVDISLIKQLHIIMIVVASGFEIDVDKYREFAHNTARLFVSKYSWYKMPPTLHKYLIHGPEVISRAQLPIGQLTEEAQEARNKEFKRFRENNSRKCSREKSNTDIFNLFLITSDPVITSKQKKTKKKVTMYSKGSAKFVKSFISQCIS